MQIVEADEGGGSRNSEISYGWVFSLLTLNIFFITRVLKH